MAAMKSWPPFAFAVLVALACASYASFGATPADPATSVYLEDLTSPELAARLAGGDTTVIVPIGGTEQSGPYIALGKHNARVRVLAGTIARQLGHAVVAPVVAYVPEGAIYPPTEHMKYTGTLSIPVAAFEGLLEGTARSLRQHGFRDIVFIGDHGGYQSSLVRVATRLNREWVTDSRTRVHAPVAYYRTAQAEYDRELMDRGLSSAQIGQHAGVADTSLSMALDPGSVRADALSRAPAPKPGDGLNGDPRRSSAAFGELGAKIIVEQTVAAIRIAIKSH
ncbi:hypothetical protein BH10PSE17_BH10PSE17_00300 [soil metagenome]